MTNKNGVPNYTFHKTGQFRNAIKHIKDRNAFEGKDENGNVILNYNKPAPVIEYLGTTKLHGTNGSIVLHSDGVISFHSKKNLLGFVKDGEFTLNSDNAGFAQEMFKRIESVKLVMKRAEEFAEGSYPVKVSGEWCGQGIQKNVGISFLPSKSFFLFGVKVKDNWLPAEAVSGLTCNETVEGGIHAITDFDTKIVEVDFNFPEKSQNLFTQYTEEVEDCCPVSEKLNLKDSQGNPRRLGEGLVWTPRQDPWCEDSGTWFKTKGQKHSVFKVKTVAQIDPEILESIEKFVDYSVTENRLQQGLQEVGLDQKNIGKFIGWINKDVYSEEYDTLERNNLTMKQVGRYIANKTRVWYITQLDQ